MGMFGAAHKSSGRLFSGEPVSAGLNKLVAAMREEVERLDDDRISASDQADLTRDFLDKYGVVSPELAFDDKRVEPSRVQKDVSQDQRLFIDDRSQPSFLWVTRLELQIPLTGESTFLFCKADPAVSDRPSAKIDVNISETPETSANSLCETLILTFDDIPGLDQDIDALITSTINGIKKNLRWVTSEIATFNQSLEGEIGRAIAARWQQLQATQALIEPLGIPLKERADAPKTYAIKVRQKIVPTLPKSATVATPPEPVLEMQHYEHVLTVMQSMATVMEPAGWSATATPMRCRLR